MTEERAPKEYWQGIYVGFVLGVLITFLIFAIIRMIT